jgi:protein arginine N-methyltransferase 2
MQAESTTPDLPIENVRKMIDACHTGDIATIQSLATMERLYCRQQDSETGLSPLMAAAKGGHPSLVKTLLEDGGAPWNALDRNNKCAGDYATDHEHWEIVNLLVDWATRSELILGKIEKAKRVASSASSSKQQAEPNRQKLSSIPVQEQSSTKPDYLQQKLTYDKQHALLDADRDAVMMEWERPIMKAHAQILLEDVSPPKESIHKPRRVLNVGFGMGIIDSILQDEWKPTQHTIIEAHPDVYAKLCKDGCNAKPNVRVCFGRWQDVLPILRREGDVEFDGIFFDTYAEHSYDMEDFHEQITASDESGHSLLSKPYGVYSFFNGLAPDNLFFHGVACNVVKLQLSKLGLDTEFLQCQMTAPPDQDTAQAKTWEGIRRKYWHGRDVYYLPRSSWNQEFLGRKTKKNGEHCATPTATMSSEYEQNGKRQRR